MTECSDCFGISKGKRECFEVSTNQKTGCYEVVPYLSYGDEGYSVDFEKDTGVVQFLDIVGVLDDLLTCLVQKRDGYYLVNMNYQYDEERVYFMFFTNELKLPDDRDWSNAHIEYFEQGDGSAMCLVCSEEALYFNDALTILARKTDTQAIYHPFGIDSSHFWEPNIMGGKKEVELFPDDWVAGKVFSIGRNSANGGRYRVNPPEDSHSSKYPEFLDDLAKVTKAQTRSAVEAVAYSLPDSPPDLSDRSYSFETFKYAPYYYDAYTEKLYSNFSFPSSDDLHYQSFSEKIQSITTKMSPIFGGDELYVPSIEESDNLTLAKNDIGNHYSEENIIGPNDGQGYHFKPDYCFFQTKVQANATLETTELGKERIFQYWNGYVFGRKFVAIPTGQSQRFLATDSTAEADSISLTYTALGLDENKVGDIVAQSGTDPESVNFIGYIPWWMRTGGGGMSSIDVQKKVESVQFNAVLTGYTLYKTEVRSGNRVQITDDWVAIDEMAIAKNGSQIVQSIPTTRQAVGGAIIGDRVVIPIDPFYDTWVGLWVIGDRSFILSENGQKAEKV